MAALVFPAGFLFGGHHLLAWNEYVSDCFIYILADVLHVNSDLFTVGERKSVQIAFSLRIERQNGGIKVLFGHERSYEI
jgi:hypothetical protein